LAGTTTAASPAAQLEEVRTVFSISDNRDDRTLMPERPAREALPIARDDRGFGTAASFPLIDASLPSSYLNFHIMALLSIISAPDPRLKIKARPVAAVDDDVRQLMDDMLETMRKAIGIGLAAPQVGVAKRVIVLDISGEGQKPQPMMLANPQILWRSPEMATFSEGCLSLPEHYADVTRPAAIRLRYLDYQNEIRELEASGLLATCIQHEIDHLDGVLFVDHISMVKRGMILRKLAKAKRSRSPVAA
jgi:peptide deformylase